jgi:hypothetical protein
VGGVLLSEQHRATAVLTIRHTDRTHCAALKMFCSNSDYLEMYPEVLERVLRWLQLRAKPTVSLLAPPG